MAKANVLGYPRIGSKRALKRALEKYWKGLIPLEALLSVAKTIKTQNWKLQQSLGVDLIPSNDFSFYDQMLDTSLMVGAIPKRYGQIKAEKSALDLYFAMARGIQNDTYDVTAMEMTKWFDTNYHYIVPEFSKNQQFELFSDKIISEFEQALTLGINTKPVLIAPVTYLLLGKEKEEGFHRLELLDNLLPVYLEVIGKLVAKGAKYIQFDEPCLALHLGDAEKVALSETYRQIANAFPDLQIVLTSYFEGYGDNLDTVLSLPISALHLDLVRCPSELAQVLEAKKLGNKILSLGVVDGRNVWKNNFDNSLSLIKKATAVLSKDNIWIASSCSLLHSPYDLDLENNEAHLPAEIKQWLAFAKQKVDEIATLTSLTNDKASRAVTEKLEANRQALQNRKTSDLIHHQQTKDNVKALTADHAKRKSTFVHRQDKQRAALKLPLYPTTTIGSFPQTKQVRSYRSEFLKNQITAEAYDRFIEQQTQKAIRFQEEIGIDVLVHGEFERNDMVEYFGEKLEGFVFTALGWVQSYGSRCVKPPIIFGDVHRKAPMTVKWSAYAQSLTQKPVKGMLTGPVTILQWSFVRDDQPRATTCKQIALAIRDEVVDLEKAGLKVIQIDEPAIREGLPLRKQAWEAYLHWAITAFGIASSGVKDETQIHTHMCYSEFNDIIDAIARMDADVITIETSRSEMELLAAFVNFKYPNEIGPGVYDIHSPRIPTVGEIEKLLLKASEVLPPTNLWVNPDCGLKTRNWEQTQLALHNMVEAARNMRAKVNLS